MPPTLTGAPWGMLSPLTLRAPLGADHGQEERIEAEVWDAEGTVPGGLSVKLLQEESRGGWTSRLHNPGLWLTGGDARPFPSHFCSGGNEIKPQIYASYAMFCTAISTALRKMCKIPNVSVGYAVAQCGNLK